MCRFLAAFLAAALLTTPAWAQSSACSTCSISGDTVTFDHSSGIRYVFEVVGGSAAEKVEAAANTLAGASNSGPAHVISTVVSGIPSSGGGPSQVVATVASGVVTKVQTAPAPVRCILRRVVPTVVQQINPDGSISNVIYNVRSGPIYRIRSRIMERRYGVPVLFVE